MSAERVRYVVGFMLDHERENVVLIQKNRPSWQAGKLNGVGGKVETGESSLDAMVREFAEEAGAFTNPVSWDLMCSISWPDDWERIASHRSPSIDFYRCILPPETSPAHAVRTMTDEPVGVIPVARLGEFEVTPNLRWLIPLAAYTADRYEPFSVNATVAEVLVAAPPSTAGDEPPE